MCVAWTVLPVSALHALHRKHKSHNILMLLICLAKGKGGWF